MTYQIDSNHTSAQFKVRHMMIANVKGEFAKVTGTVDFDPSNTSLAKVDVNIDVASLVTGQPPRDEHLKGADFFDAANHPQITFKSKSVSAASGGGYKVAGDLTLRGVTKPVTLDVEPVSGEIKDMWGSMRRGTAASTRIKRSDFGMAWNAPVEGGVLVSDDVDITIDLQMTRKAE
jgi:polyisoprenoid-binding protein YceI